MVGCLVAWLFDSWVGGLLGWVVDRRVGLLVGWLVGCSVNWLVSVCSSLLDVLVHEATRWVLVAGCFVFVFGLLGCICARLLGCIGCTVDVICGWLFSWLVG